MGKTSGSTIEINGKRYDALTGAIVHGHGSAAHAKKAPARDGGSVHSMDGVVRQHSQHSRHAHSAHKAAHRQPKPARSRTLMRHAVRKPAHSKPTIEQRSTPVTAAPSIAAQPAAATLFSHGDDSARIKRAKHIDKSSLVKRFSDFTTNTYQSVQAAVKPTAMPVKQPPIEAEAAPVTHAKPKPGEAMMRKALANAQSHQATPHKKAKLRHRTARKFGTSTKVISAAAACLAILLLGGFFAYQNVPNFAMRVAATRSGVNASLPGYKPAGFASKGKVQFSSGQVTVGFHSTTDSRSFTINQQNSEWTSEALLTNYVTGNSKMYQTYEDQGRTIYIYDGSNATWVNSGVWYNITGNSNLNSEQLVRIATSM